MSTSAPAHACACQSSYGLMAYAKIWSGSAAMGCVSFVDQKELPNAVNSRGAVSPATRATATSTPVTMPPSAVRSTTWSEVRQCG